MDANPAPLSRNQLIFAEVLVGFLIYVMVLGLFDEYTDLVSAKSFSTIVFASIVLEALTFLTFLLKDWWIGWWTQRRGELLRWQKLLAMWPIMFFSKLVFLWALGELRGDTGIRLTTVRSWGCPSGGSAPHVDLRARKTTMNRMRPNEWPANRGRG